MGAFSEQMAAAELAWRVTALIPPTPTEAPLIGGLDVEVRYVGAEARTGSRYAVVATRLPGYATEREGGTVLVTVLSPWQDATVMQDGGHLDPSYVAEKLTGGRYRAGQLHGGDLMALTLTVRCALGREEAP